MRINSISAANYVNRTQSFKCNNCEAKPLINVPIEAKDDEVVAYGTWGPNYVYPITAGQMKPTQKEIEERLSTPKQTSGETETPEEYYRRKINSTEWGAY